MTRRTIEKLSLLRPGPARVVYSVVLSLLIFLSLLRVGGIAFGSIQRAPLLIRLAIMNAMLFLGVLVISPPYAHAPIVYLPLIWMGSYCAAFIVVSLLWRGRMSPRLVHWI